MYFSDTILERMSAFPTCDSNQIFLRIYSYEQYVISNTGITVY